MTTPIEQQLQKKILILDGAMGTMLQKAGLSAADFGGERLEGCNDYLNLTAPHIILQIHRQYLEAGADIIETNTFGATRVVLGEYGLAEKAGEINRKGAELARRAADEYSTPGRPRFVAGSMGPTTKTLSVTGGISFDELAADYEEQAAALIQGGADLLLIETCQDTLNVKAAYQGICRAFAKLDRKLPLIVSGTIEPMGTTLAGQSIEAFYISLEHMNLLAIGLNCATGPELMADHLRSLSALATTYTSCYPNAGLPDEEGHYHETPASLATKVSGFAAKGWINIIGGCCGTTPDHIRAVARAVAPYPPRRPPKKHPHTISGTEPLIYDAQSMRPLFVGERANVIGSRKFKELIAAGKYEEASEIARNQVKSGAHVIDICLANPDRNELEDMKHFLSFVIKKVKVPLMIDSTDPLVIEQAFKLIQGKALINSVNLEEGERRFAQIVPLIKQYGAAVVVGMIDETGMATTAARKLAVARRSYDLLVNRYGLDARDLIFDPLVFPVGTGDEQYMGAATETMEGLRRIKREFPEAQTILGLSNVSFGLPPAGREVLNAVFLYHCTKAGLDYAIVNTEKLKRFASIPENEIRLAENLLFHTSPETLTEFTAFFRDKKPEESKPQVWLPLAQRLSRHVIEGSKDGLPANLQEALASYPSPLDIINGPLMDGMAEVGRLFNENQLIVAEVLQSAEVMKTAVSFLEPYMDGKEGSHGKGKIVLATVKGDVHDIGKNLVDIILSNNGFTVVDLGIKISSAELIAAVRKEKPQLIGLSGLLVKSAQQMALTAQDLAAAGISTPILVGGAALSAKFVAQKIAPEYGGAVVYAKDAMAGLSSALQLVGSGKPKKSVSMEPTLRPTQSTTANSIKPGAEQVERPSLPQSIPPSQLPHPSQQPSPLQQTQPSPLSVIAGESRYPLFTPPDYRPHVLHFKLAQVEPYLNLQMLFGHHLGLKGSLSRHLAENDPKAMHLAEEVGQVLEQAKKEELIQPAAKYQFFPAQSRGNDILIYSPADFSQVIERFSFPRQKKAPYLCLADFLAPAESKKMDSVAFLAVTAGQGIRDLAAELKNKGQYLDTVTLQALALETAEGTAERVHQMIRDRWGFPDPSDFTMQERFSAKYQGQRFSFGYPACPALEDQEKLFRLLKPEDIGIQLTSSYMMDPEASVTAMVFAHPEARYFDVAK